jgi:hypothetical protein
VGVLAWRGGVGLCGAVLCCVVLYSGARVVSLCSVVGCVGYAVSSVYIVGFNFR